MRRQTQLMKWTRERKPARILSVALVASWITLLSCFRAGPSESVRPIPPEISPTTPVVTVTLSLFEKVLIPVISEEGVVEPGRMMLRREVPLAEVGRETPDGALWRPRDQENLLVLPVELTPGVVETVGGDLDSAGNPALVERPSSRRDTAQRRSAGDLKSLEYAYRLALSSLFKRRSDDSYADRYGASDASTNLEQSLLADDPFGDRNPFEEALESELATDAQEMPPAPASQEAAPDLPPQEPETPRVPRVLANLLPVAGEVEGPFSFLLHGEFAADDEERVFRAYRDGEGDFLLENSTKFAPAGGLLTFQLNEQILTVDLNHDGVTDLISATSDFGDTLIRTFVGKSGLRFERTSATTVAGKVAGMAVFELTGDGVDDLVLVIEGVPHLSIYERTETGFLYRKELVLPFMPGLLAESPGADGTPRSLRVFDSELSQVVVFTLEHQDAYAFGPDSDLDLLDTFILDGVRSEDSFTQLISLEAGGRFTLAQKKADGIQFHGSFMTGDRLPLVIFGDYFDFGDPHLLLVP